MCIHAVSWALRDIVSETRRASKSGLLTAWKHGPHSRDQTWPEKRAKSVGTHCGCPRFSSKIGSVFWPLYLGPGIGHLFGPLFAVNGVRRGHEFHLRRRPEGLPWRRGWWRSMPGGFPRTLGWPHRRGATNVWPARRGRSMPAEVLKTLGWLTLEALASTQMLTTLRRFHSRGSVCHASGFIKSILGRVTNRFTVMGIQEENKGTAST